LPLGCLLEWTGAAQGEVCVRMEEEEADPWHGAVRKTYDGEERV
jgi:hypothetical protein